ncbi:MAG: PEGA domain-containing protein [Patescibacteria group bacterium]|nr:PEGA domain-containing protein [Patescibacteria group bacterium]
MPKKIRDWLFIIFIILFVIITFFVSVYAAGYSISKRWPPRFDQIFQKTGMLIIDSEPAGAYISLNGERLRKSILLDIGRSDTLTPNRIKNLPPGEYTLTLEKDGYWPLEKKVSIYPGQTTFAEDFILFKRSLPLNLSLCAPQSLELSPDNKRLLLPEEGTAINLKTEVKSDLGLQSSSEEIQWSKDGARVLFGGKILNLDNGQSNDALAVVGQEANNFYWDENGKKIYYAADGNINCILTDNNTISTVLSGSDYAAYTVYGNLIYTIERQNGQMYLRLYSADNHLLQNSISLPAGDYVFRQDKYHLNLYDRKQKALYLLNDYARQPINKQLRPVAAWQWLNSSTLMWYNEFEIYSFDLNGNRQELLIRVSEKLTGAAWNQSKNYMIYADSAEIKIIDLNLDKRSPITLLKAEEISSLALDEKNQLLYFYAKIGQQAGIYKLQLQ